MILSELLVKSKIEYSLSGNADIEIEGICYDSRKAHEGMFFFCLSGSLSDGHKYALKAYESGCRVFALEREVELPSDAVCVFFENTRQALAYVSSAFFDYPSEKMKIVGITGTKGKTTVANMLCSCLCNAGIMAGYIGTSGIDYAGKHFETKNTTPESLELHKTFRDMLDEGVKIAVLEVSSQALFNYRVDGIEFYCGIYTNLSPDHIGPTEHPSFEHYKNCKKRLFSLCRYGIFNASDEYFRDMSEGASCKITTYGIDKEADYSAEDISAENINGKLCVSFTALCDSSKARVSLPIPGRFSVLNALAAFSACRILGVPTESIAESMKSVYVKGRFEIVPIFNDRTFVIDYAHNEVSMQMLLTTVREYSPKRIVCLFGSVGERTKGRRRELASVASRLADFCIITSDNPGNENPDDIISEIASFFASGCEYVKITDREEAIRYAVRNSRPGDVVLLCGKGHENYQLIGSERVPFSEKAILLDEALN